MTVQINKAGFSTIKVNCGAGLQILGYSLDMVDERDQAYWHDVPGDLHGGPQGPPIDSQLLGRLLHVRVELSKYDEAVLKKLRHRLATNNNSVEGVLADSEIGMLAFQDNKSIAVYVASANQPRYYSKCILREPIEVGRGTKFSTLILTFEAHRNQTSGAYYALTT